MKNLDKRIVQRLLNDQFPQFSSSPIKPVAVSGWDNRIFHIGQDYVARLPSAAAYASQAIKERRWLPKLAPHLPVVIPEPIGFGQPGCGYPYHWAIYRWIPGITAFEATMDDKRSFAADVSGFLSAMHRIDTEEAPAPGDHNSYRGGSLKIYDAETRTAISLLNDRYDSTILTEIWEAGLHSRWNADPVWVHGDVTAGNLLVGDNGRLCGVIDFGLIAAGDPACDLAIAWTYFDDESRKEFRSGLQLDDDTWLRARSWALWKAAIVRAGISNTNAVERATAANTIIQIVSDHSADGNLTQ